MTLSTGNSCQKITHLGDIWKLKIDKYLVILKGSEISHLLEVRNGKQESELRKF